jgi:hypothetical protein
MHKSIVLVQWISRPLLQHRDSEQLDDRRAHSLSLVPEVRSAVTLDRITGMILREIMAE